MAGWRPFQECAEDGVAAFNRSAVVCFEFDAKFARVFPDRVLARAAYPMVTDSAVMSASGSLRAAGDPSTALMLRVRDGDAAAFAELVALWQPRLVTLFVHHVGDHATAEDLAQEVFLRVFRARAGYRPTAKFTTWVHTIANNVASDLKQRAYRRRERGVPMSASASSSAIGLDQLAIAASGLLPARQADRSEVRQVVQEAIAGLAERQRMALLLAKFEGCSYDEIATAMRLSVPAVKSLIFRARDQLRQALGAYLDEDEAARGGDTARASVGEAD
jgi:RNA polymerase sigma-70 factor (ECF subfamily)